MDECKVALDRAQEEKNAQLNLETSFLNKAICFEMSDVICRNIINMINSVEDNLEKCENLNHNLDLSDE